MQLIKTFDTTSNRKESIIRFEVPSVLFDFRNTGYRVITIAGLSQFRLCQYTWEYWLQINKREIIHIPVGFNPLNL